MKIVLIIIGVLVVLVLCIVVIGSLLPKRHVASRSAVFNASPERLFALIAGSQQWRSDVKSCELLTKERKQFQRETSNHNETILYELQNIHPPLSIERRIATENLPYAGTWSFTLTPENAGTRVRITEDGEVYNPIFRFVSKFILGQTATQDAYLKAMGKATDEEVRPEN
jgi:hypothetical protein